MGAVDLGAGDGRRGGKKGGAKKPKRVGFVLDMTPLVDIAFLLLTFFMFATTMAQPTLMEMKIPPDIDTEVPVEDDNLLNIYIDAEDDIYYSTGLDTTFNSLKIEDLQSFAIEQNAQKENDLITSLKLHPEASYSQLVYVLDELNKAEATLTLQYMDELNVERKRKFSIQRLDSVSQFRLEQL